jgi:hypothetical protein
MVGTEYLKKLREEGMSFDSLASADIYNKI